MYKAFWDDIDSLIMLQEKPIISIEDRLREMLHRTIEWEDHRKTVEVAEYMSNYFQFHKEKLDSAMKYFRVAQMNAKQHLNHYDTLVSNMSHQGAILFLELGEVDSFFFYIKQEGHILDSLFSPTHPALCLHYNSLGYFWMNNKNRPDSARFYFNKSLKAFLSVNDTLSSEAGMYYSNMGITFFHEGNWDSALYYQRLALAARRNGGKSLEIINSSYNLASLMGSIGMLDSAEYYHQLSLSLAQELFPPEHSIFAYLYSDLGSFSSEKGKYEKALDFLRQAADIFSADTTRCPGGICKTLANVYNNMGIAFKGIGNRDSQLYYYQLALEIRLKESREPDKDVATAWNNIGQTYWYRDEKELAFVATQKALRMRETLNNDPLGLVNSHSTLGNMYQDLGEYEAALGQFELAYQLAQEGLFPHHPVYIDAVSNLVHYHQTQGEWALAHAYLTEFHPQIPYADEEVLLVESLNSDAIQSYLDFFDLLAQHHQHDYAQNQSTSSSLQLALKAYQDMVAILHWALDHYMMDQPQLRLLEDFRSKAISAMHICQQLYQLDTDARWINAGLQMGEQLRSVVLSRQVYKHRQALSSPEIAALQGRALELKALIKKDDQTRASASNDSKVLQDRIINYRLSLDSVQRAIQSLNPDWAELMNGNPQFGEQLSQQLQQAVSNDALLIEYFQADSHLFVFAVSPDTILFQQHELDQQFHTHLEQLILDMRQAPAEAVSGSALYIQSFAKLSHEVYADLIAPVLQSLPSLPTSLIIIPDGRLNLLPFDALVSEPIPTATSYQALPYLFQRFRIRYTYSSTIFLQDQANVSLSKSARKGYAGFIPDYDKTSWTAPVSEDACRGWNDMFGFLRFSLLAVQDLAKRYHGTAYLAEKATESQFKRHAGRHKILDLPLHAYTCLTDPLLSGIVLGSNPNSTDQEDGILYAYEIFGLDLPAELILLTGCYTGDGPLSQGEGILSLGRAFRYAGCPNLVQSLWTVGDREGGEISKLFLAHLKQGHGKAKAMQLARTEFLAHPQIMNKHPHTWANLILIGDDEAVSFGNAWWQR